MLSFPGSEDQRVLRVNLDHLRMIHRMELGHPAKLAYKLTDKVLNPSVLERDSVKLAAETTCAALRFYAEHRPDCAGFSDTAAFLELVRRWLNVCNVKLPPLAQRLNDRSRMALRAGCEGSERSLAFISNFGDYMRSLLDSGTPIMKDICVAVFYSCRSLVRLMRYLLSMYSDRLDYVLTGKIHSDYIDGNFAYLRKLSGGSLG